MDYEEYEAIANAYDELLVEHETLKAKYAKLVDVLLKLSADIGAAMAKLISMADKEDKDRRPHED